MKVQHCTWFEGDILFPPIEDIITFNVCFLSPTLTDPPRIASISFNQMVAQEDVVLLNCTAHGNPEPIITWTRLSDNSIVRMPLNITGKQDEGGYRCTAYNGIGNATTSDVFITVRCKSLLSMHNNVCCNMVVSDGILRHHIPSQTICCS